MLDVRRKTFTQKEERPRSDISEIKNLISHLPLKNDM